MSEEILEKVYRENLEERLVAYLAEVKDISYEKAMNIYYSSKLCSLINEGKYDIQYLDYKVLAQLV